MPDHPVHFLADAPESDAARQLFEDDLAGQGFVMNLTRMWAHQPALKTQLFALIGASATAAGLSMRQRGVLVSAMASTHGDSYCALAWGTRLANESTPDTAAAVLRGDDPVGLDDTVDPVGPADRALAAWARGVTGRPNDLTEADVQPLRDAGFDDAQILAITLFVGLRLAFSTVNDALGVRPDGELVDQAPAAVLAAVTFGRAPSA